MQLTRTLQSLLKGIRLNKYFEGSCELLSKQCDVMSISWIFVLQTAICPLYISLTCNVCPMYISFKCNVCLLTCNIYPLYIPYTCNVHPLYIPLTCIVCHLYNSLSCYVHPQLHSDSSHNFNLVTHRQTNRLLELLLRS